MPQQCVSRTKNRGKNLKTWERRLSYRSRTRTMRKKQMLKRQNKSISPEPSSSENSKRFKTGNDSIRIIIEENDSIDIKIKDNEIRINIENNSNDGISTQANLLDLSDDVLLIIIKHLDPFDIMNLSICCQRLDRVTRDRTLWTVMDFRDRIMSVEELKKFIKFFQPSVQTFAVRGNSSSNSYSEFSKNFLQKLIKTCLQLKELIIEEFYINGAEIKISDYPSSLEKLSLKSCNVDHLDPKKSYFFQVNNYLPKLTCLILSNCKWFASHSLMVLSKMPKLKELRLDSCDSFGECLAYASLATRYGFKTLEILDLRNTVVGDSEICCFSSTKTLTHLYLECPPRLRNTQVNNMNGRVEESNPQEVERPRILGRPVYEDRHVAQVQVQILQQNELVWHDADRFSVTDRAICALGSYVCERRIVDNIAGNVFRVEENSRISNNPNLKALVIRYYPQVTDRSLRHLAVSKSTLEYVDVTGTAVTREGVQLFKAQKPEVEIVSSFDDV